MKRSERSPSSGEAGFTIVEGLVAALILAIILIGILPLVTQSMRNTLQGNDATNESNAVTGQLEELYSLPFNSPKVTITAGTTLVAVDYFLLNDGTWATAIPTGDQAQYTRTTTVEQFSAVDLEDDGTLDLPLDATALPGQIQLKRITMLLQKPRTLGDADYTVVALKSH